MLYITIIVILLCGICFLKIRKQKNTHSLHEFDLVTTTPLRGILIICVMLCHICPYFVIVLPFLKDPCLWGPPSVACFFMMAGYGLGMQYKAKGNCYLDSFFKKRLSKLLFPCIIMTFIYQTYRFCHNDFTFYMLIKEPSPNFWFLYALFINYVGFYLSFKYGKTLNHRFILLGIFYLFYLTITISLGLSYYYISILPFPLSIIYVFYEDQARSLIIKNACISTIFVMVIMVAILSYATYGQYCYIKLPGWGPLVYVTLPFFILYVVYWLGCLDLLLLKITGKASFEFYIAHGFWVMLLGNQSFLTEKKLNALFVISLIFILSLSSSWILFKANSYLQKSHKS